MPGTVSAHQSTPVTNPQNGQSPIDADQVTDNDNGIIAVTNDHDADPTIHFQSSILASRPAAGTEGRKWLTTDNRRIFYDTGAAWAEVFYRPRVPKELSAMPDASAVLAFTITVPNAADTASFNIEAMGWLGAGGSIGAHEGASTISARIIVTRTPGVAAVATLTTTHAASLATVAGGQTATIAVTIGSVVGDVGAVNTFAVNLTISRGTASATNHAAVAWAELIAAVAGAITIAAAA